MYNKLVNELEKEFGVKTDKGTDVRKSLNESHSHSKCMECDAKPTVEVLWANGHGHAWFCDSCFNKWKTTGDGKGEIISAKKIDDGEAASKFADNKNPNMLKKDGTWLASPQPDGTQKSISVKTENEAETDPQSDADAIASLKTYVDNGVFDWKHDIADLHKWCAKMRAKGAEIYQYDSRDDQYVLFALKQELSDLELQKLKLNYFDEGDVEESKSDSFGGKTGLDANIDMHPPKKVK